MQKKNTRTKPKWIPQQSIHPHLYFTVCDALIPPQQQYYEKISHETSKNETHIWMSFKLVVADLFNYLITLLFSISKHFFLWQKHQQF